MTIDYLDAPLGLKRKPPRPRVMPGAWALLSGLLGGAILLFPTWATLGARVPEPSSVMTRAKPKSNDRVAQENSLPETSAEARLPLATEGARSVHTITIIDGRTGAREEVEILAGVEDLPNEPPSFQGSSAAIAPTTIAKHALRSQTMKSGQRGEGQPSP
jgi:hypothetical protein